MLELLALGFLVAALLVVASVGLVILKLIFWIVLLPFRLLFWLLLLPFLLFKAVIGFLALVLVGPLVLLALVASAIAAALALLVPLLPLVALGLLIWLLVKATQPALTV